MRKHIGIVIVIAVMLGIAMLAVSTIQVWTEVSGSSVNVNGGPLSASKLYVSGRGEYLIHIEDSTGTSGDFFVYPALNKVGFGARAWRFLGFAITSKTHLDENVLSGTDKFPGRLEIENNHFNIFLPNGGDIIVCFSACMSR